MFLQPWLSPDAIRARLRITCPCCSGKKNIRVIRHDDDKSRTFVEYRRCLQCDGTGEIEDLSGG